MMSEGAGDAVTYEKASWGVKAMILAGGPAVGLALGGINIVLPKVAAELAHTEFDQFLVKMLGGIVGAAMLIGAPGTGYLADRIGLRKVLIITYTLFTIAGAAGMFLTNLEIFLAARFLLGIAGSAAVTASIIIVNKRLAPGERATWMGYYIAASYVATILLHPIAGVLGNHNWHYAFSIYLSGAPLILIGLLAFNDAPQAVQAAQQADAAADRPFMEWFPFGLALLALFMGLITYLGVTYIPFQLAKMGVEPKMMGFLLLPGSFTGIVTSWFFGRARKTLSDDAAFIFAFSTTAIGGFIAAFAPNYIWVMVGYGVYGLGTGWFMPNLMFALGKRVTGQYQGRTAGFVKACNYIGYPLSIVLFESSAQKYGNWVPLLAWGILAAILTVFYTIRVIGARGSAVAKPAEAVS
jgi:MFS family permease